MSTLQVKVLPHNPGVVEVTVANASSTAPGTPLNETFEVSNTNPLDKTWEVETGPYKVKMTWSAGFQNIAGDGGGNAIRVNGQDLTYQVAGEPVETHGIYATFPVEVP